MTSKSESVVYVSIGSNIEPEKNLQEAVNKLREYCTVLATSSVYQAPAYGDSDQPDFLDIVVRLRTDRTPEEFKCNILRKIEADLGRVRTPENKYGPLTLDLDIMLWDAAAFEYGDKPWRVPNDGILNFAADAIPLAEIAGDMGSS